ncbi:MAG: DsbA family oxidoreductase [Leptospira sp.]|nr:DsbA family oxidoreductase [Leptospira sp.]
MKLIVQIVSDVVCPWCYIGKVNWDKASNEWLKENPGTELEVEMKPFRLDPTLPMDGQPRDQVLGQKFGSPEKMKVIIDRTKKAASEVGIQMEFLPGVQQPNTLHCHRLIRLAKDFDIQKEMGYILFDAYFTKNENLTDPEKLNAMAREVGIPEDRLQSFWKEDECLQDTVIEEERMRSLGVTGVPFFIINDQYAFSGAQSPDVFKQILDEIAKK